MTLLLDTDLCIDLIRGRRREVRAAFLRRAASDGPLGVSAATLLELVQGVRRSAPEHRAANQARLDAFREGPVEVLPFDPEDAEATGALAAVLQDRGLAIGPYDTMIAGQALRRGLTVVTSNARHFGRVPGLATEGWRDPAAPPTPP